MPSQAENTMNATLEKALGLLQNEDFQKNAQDLIDVFKGEGLTASEKEAKLKELQEKDAARKENEQQLLDKIKANQDAIKNNDELLKKSQEVVAKLDDDIKVIDGRIGEIKGNLATLEKEGDELDGKIAELEKKRKEQEAENQKLKDELGF